MLMSKSKSETRKLQDYLVEDLTTLVHRFQVRSKCAVKSITVRNNDDRFGAPRLLGVEVEIEVDAEDAARERVSQTEVRQA